MMRRIIFWTGIILILCLFMTWDTEEKYSKEGVLASPAAAEMERLIQDLVLKAGKEYSYEQLIQRSLAPKYIQEHYPELAGFERIIYNIPYIGAPKLPLLKAYNKDFILIGYLDSHVECEMRDVIKKD